MQRRKTLQDLTIRDNFMFTEIMMEEDNCKELLERILQIEIDHIEIEQEKTMSYHPEYHGIRMDVYVKDEHNTRYDVEMQTGADDIELRTRYYHSQMDMNLLLAGEDYENLPTTYVIFICNYDPLGYGKYCYTIDSSIRECDHQPFEDKSHTIILNTYGKNDVDVSEKLKEFLNFVREHTADRTYITQDTYINRLQQSIDRVKGSREKGEQYMLLEELMRKERKEGREEGRKEGHMQGLAEGEQLITQLTKLLLADNRIADLTRSTEDIEYRKTLLQEYHLL